MSLLDDLRARFPDVTEEGTAVLIVRTEVPDDFSTDRGYDQWFYALEEALVAGGVTTNVPSHERLDPAGATPRVLEIAGLLEGWSGTPERVRSILTAHGPVHPDWAGVWTGHVVLPDGQQLPL